ncbi:MAG: AAA family ATPase [Verrucomicrobiota bacterium]
MLQKYSRMNVFDDPDKTITVSDIAAVAKGINGFVRCEEKIVKGIIHLARAIQQDPSVRPGGKPSSRSLSHYVLSLKARAFLQNETEVKWEMVHETAESVLGHKILFAPEASVQPRVFLNTRFKQLYEEDQDQWPLVVTKHAAMELERAMGICAQFQNHLCKEVQGRENDAEPSTIQLLLTALLADGHILLEDFPGSGKTRMAKSLARLIRDDIKEPDVDIEPYHRIQCTPDLMPSDITGYSKLESTGAMRFQPGPIFAYFLLVDEINRTTPKVQSAFLEAMAEKSVTVDNHTHCLSDLFFVVATQNPLDRAGTFELPAAQLDRFLFKRRLESIGIEYEGNLMIEEALKFTEAVSSVAQGREALSQKMREERRKALLQKMREELKKRGTMLTPDSPPSKERPVTNAVGVSEIIRARQAILSQMPIHEDLVPKILEVADAIKAKIKANVFRNGSRPSVRSMMKFINATKVLAFIRRGGDAARRIALPGDFRTLACDLLRHRLIPDREKLTPQELDEVIINLVTKIIPE